MHLAQTYIVLLTMQMLHLPDACWLSTRFNYYCYYHADDELGDDTGAPDSAADDSCWLRNM